MYLPRRMYLLECAHFLSTFCANIRTLVLACSRLQALVLSRISVPIRSYFPTDFCVRNFPTDFCVRNFPLEFVNTSRQFVSTCLHLHVHFLFSDSGHVRFFSCFSSYAHATREPAVQKPHPCRFYSLAMWLFPFAESVCSHACN